ncbi:MAG: hypothetical protein methR_P0943 [Methyloprofundus sp.]|nr:MAG: hypothetical protein methR_P0943 [Methyloprofundus sp.]
MTQLNRKRINFIEHLHEIFVNKKGYGAFAYISASDAVVLFEQYLDSNEAADSFINRYVNSI